MKVLIGCEFSGVVREAFRVLGHDAWSCDLQPADDESPFHLQGDILSYLTPDWDLLIAHPPCTYLASSGARWLYSDFSRMAKAREAANFAISLSRAPIRHIALENPRGKLATMWQPSSQTIHPWQFGHPETKETHLWLINLPPLQPTNIVSGRESRIRNIPSSKRQAKLRSITYPGIAAAMADQWSTFILTKKGASS